MTRSYGFPPSRFVLFLALMFLSVVCMQAANAQTTINVPTDQATIQAAIVAAQPGDTVLVAPGTYLENLDFLGKAITVTSSGGPNVTIVDGNGAGPVVGFHSGEGAGSVLKGLTLRNGFASDTAPFFSFGGGISILNSSPTITGNTITGNRAVSGIGIEVRNGSPVIRGNVISGNTQAGGDGGGGGGIEVTGDTSHPVSSPLITGNTITNNSMIGGGDGGAISASFNASPIIQDNFISGNAVFNSGGGISVDSISSTPAVVTQNIIVSNSAGAGGSGGGISASRNAIVTGNTIVGNTAFDGSSGIFADRFPSITIASNIVVALTGQTGIVCSQFSSIFPTFSHNDVTSPGGGQAYSSNCAPAAEGNGNISLDPQFVNAASGDYHLQATSPAIDAGDNSAPNLPTQDLDGRPRIAFGNSTACSNTVDMGVYEFVAPPPAAALSVASFDFGSVAVGTASNPLTITYTASQGCVAVPNIFTNSPDFHETNTCSSVLGTGASCTIQVTFIPTVSGARGGTLIVASGALASLTNFTGQGTAPLAAINPSVSFGNQAVGTTSQAQFATLVNLGSAPLQISGISVSGDFAQTNNCPAALAPGADCTFLVTFTPVTGGVRTGNLVVSSNGGAASSTLTGIGISDFAVSVSPASLSVKAGSPGQSTVTVSALGGTLTSATTLACSGLPTGTACSFSPASIGTGVASGASVLTISTSDSSGGRKPTPRGTYNITVTATGSTTSHSAVISLTVR